MMDAITSLYLTAFLLGVFSTMHCIAMCGSVIGALTLSLPSEVRENQRRMFPYVLNYNLGRLLSYGLAGSLVGWMSSPLADINGLQILQYVSVAIMVAMGLYLAGLFPNFARLERLGSPLWKMLQPLSQRLLPVQKQSQAFALGMVWGWLPCGLVYAALATAATSGGSSQGALVMIAFGLGTLPAVMGAGLFTGVLSVIGGSKRIRQSAGLVIILMALWTLLEPVDHSQHHGHHATVQGAFSHG